MAQMSPSHYADLHEGQRVATLDLKTDARASTRWT